VFKHTHTHTHGTISRRDGALRNLVNTQHTHPNSKSQKEVMIARGRGSVSVFGALGVDEGISYLVGSIRSRLSLHTVNENIESKRTGAVNVRLA
jgi:UPF0288 family protein (methanogenesis marker protein 3)